MTPKYSNPNGPRYFSYVFLLTFVILMESCSLVKIESEQRPLGIRDLNTRLLTQNFAKTAMDRVELAADSIAALATDQKDVQINSIYWKLRTSEELGKLSFQTEPKIALLDSWAYFLEVKKSFETEALESIFGPYKMVAIEAIGQNIDEIDKIAASVLTKKEYNEIKDFVERYAEDSPLLSQKEFKHKSIREAYLEFKQIPDSLAVQTVGSLSEVVADASNRFGYYSNASNKRFDWKTELILKENGLDSIAFEEKLAEFESQFNRLLEVAENSPETLEDAIKEFRNNISPLFRNLNYQIGSAMQSLSTDVQAVDKMLNRERLAIDSIVKRERMALAAKADVLVETGIENAFDGLGKVIRNLIIYFILLFVVILGVPFYMGYLTGKRKFKP